MKDLVGGCVPGRDDPLPPIHVEVREQAATLAAEIEALKAERDRLQSMYDGMTKLHAEACAELVGARESLRTQMIAVRALGVAYLAAIDGRSR